MSVLDIILHIHHIYTSKEKGKMAQENHFTRMMLKLNYQLEPIIIY